MPSVLELPRPALSRTERFLVWHEQLPLHILCKALRPLLTHPYLAAARQHYRSADGMRLTAAEAETMLKAARRKGSELVELAVLTHRDAMLRMKAPPFVEMSGIGLTGFLHHADAPFWGDDASRAAHEDVLQAIQWSQFALVAAATQYDRTVNSMVETSITDYSQHSSLVAANRIQQMDMQAHDIALRTRMPLGYVYFFVCTLVYYRLACSKQMEMLL